MFLSKLEKYLKKSIDSSLKVYYTMSEHERRRAKKWQEKNLKNTGFL